MIVRLPIVGDTLARRVGIACVIAVGLGTLVAAGAARAQVDGLQYIASYPDLIRAFGANATAGVQHYQQYGQAEGRSPDSFNEAQYLANYGDLRAAFGADGTAATVHYIQNGLAEGRTDKPNLVVILADDLGWGEVGARHVGDVATPNIDAIAQAGVTFTDGYVPANLCVPSRAGLITGRYPQEFGFYRNPKRPYPASFGLPDGETTLAEALRARGYATGMVGKWHLGMKSADHPQLHGFDEYLRAARHRPPLFRRDLRQSHPERHRSRPGLRLSHRHAGRRGRRLHPAPRRPAILPLRPVHGDPQPAPGQARGAGAAEAHIRNPKRRLVAAVLASLDEGVGRILAELRATGVAERTAVVFLGDNGCGACRNRPLRGGKGTLWEGGIRVPFILAWPGRVGAGTSYGEPVIAMDLFATFLRAAGGVPSGVVDGIDLLPYLQGRRRQPARLPLLGRAGQGSDAQRRLEARRQRALQSAPGSC